MQHINSLFGGTQKKIMSPSKTRNTERGDLMDYFLKMLNPRRMAAGYPPLDFPRLGMLLKGRDTQFLYMLKRLCDDSNNWSATFYYTLNPDKYADKGKKANTAHRNDQKPAY